MTDNDNNTKKNLNKEDANDQEDTTDKEGMTTESKEKKNTQDENDTDVEERKKLEGATERTVKTDQNEQMEDQDQKEGKADSGQEFIRRKPKVELIERRGNFQGPLCVIKPAKRKSSSNAKKRLPPEKPTQIKDDDNDYWDCPECTFKNKAEVDIS